MSQSWQDDDRPVHPEERDLVELLGPFLPLVGILLLWVALTCATIRANQGAVSAAPAIPTEVSR
jgi:hypothetical protein